MRQRARNLKAILWSFVFIAVVFGTLDWTFGLENQVRFEAMGELGVSVPYRIAFDPTIPPYQFLGEKGYEGFFIELMDAFARERGLLMELVPMPSAMSIDRLKANAIHGILGMRYSSEIEQELAIVYSDSLVSSTLSIVMLASEASSIKEALGSSNVLIAVERDSVEFEFVKNIKKANFNLGYNQESVLSLLLMNRAQMAIGVRHVAEYQLDQWGLAGAYVISNSYETPVDFYLVMDGKYSELVNQFNAQLRTQKINGVYEDAYNRWINDKNLLKQQEFERNLVLMGLVIASVVVLALLIVGINVRLKRRINLKTSELRVANEELEKKIFEIKNTVELKDLIFESSPRSIAIFDNKGKISAMNEHVLKLCGLESTPIGERIFEYSPLKEMLQPYIDLVYNEGQRYMALEYQYEKEGIKRYLRYYLYPLFDYEKNSRGAIITIEDITEERHYKSQAIERAKSKALSRLIAGIAHEIRNPLTSIKTYAELIPRKFSNENFRQQLTMVIPTEVERVNQLIENLIDYAKPKIVESESLQLSDVIDSCLLLFKPSFEKSGVGIERDLGVSIHIFADKNQLKQVIINLLLNAIDAIEANRLLSEEPHKGLIKITTKALGQEHILQIRDNGIGMTSDELEHVFELFYTTKVKGSGIGLPLSKQLIEENGGQIQIESVKYVGTTITLRFKEVDYAS